jgi:hypothetical protein
VAIAKYFLITQHKLQKVTNQEYFLLLKNKGGFE